MTARGSPSSGSMTSRGHIPGLRTEPAGFGYGNNSPSGSMTARRSSSSFGTNSPLGSTTARGVSGSTFPTWLCCLQTHMWGLLQPDLVQTEGYTFLIHLHMYSLQYCAVELYVSLTGSPSFASMSGRGTASPSGSMPAQNTPPLRSMTSNGAPSARGTPSGSRLSLVSVMPYSAMSTLLWQSFSGFCLLILVQKDVLLCDCASQALVVRLIQWFVDRLRRSIA